MLKDNLHILYVDDDDDIRTIVDFALADEPDFIVTICSSGQEALNALQQELTPHIILLDVMMPELDGPETLQQLRLLSNHHNTPVVFITAKVQPKEVEQLLTQGAIAVIAKPFDPLTLPEQIREIWAGYQNER